MDSIEDDKPLTKAEIDRMMVAIATVTPPLVENGNPLLKRILDHVRKGRGPAYVTWRTQAAGNVLGG